MLNIIKGGDDMESKTLEQAKRIKEEREKHERDFSSLRARVVMRKSIS